MWISEIFCIFGIMVSNGFDKGKLIKYWIEGSDDNYKRSFKEQCTPEFTFEWVGKIEEIRTWIKTLISQ